MMLSNFSKGYREQHPFAWPAAQHDVVPLTTWQYKRQGCTASFAAAVQTPIAVSGLTCKHLIDITSAFTAAYALGLPVSQQSICGRCKQVSPLAFNLRHCTCHNSTEGTVSDQYALPVPLSQASTMTICYSRYCYMRMLTPPGWPTALRRDTGWLQQSCTCGLLLLLLLLTLLALLRQRIVYKGTESILPVL